MTDKIKLIKDVEHIASNMDKRVTFTILWLREEKLVLELSILWIGYC